MSREWCSDNACERRTCHRCYPRKGCSEHEKCIDYAKELEQEREQTRVVKGGPFFAREILIQSVEALYQSNLAFGKAIDKVRVHDPEDNDFLEIKQTVGRLLDFYNTTNIKTQELITDLNRVALPSKKVSKGFAPKSL